MSGQIKPRTPVVSIFPNEAAITRLVGAILMQQPDEWAVQRARNVTLETIAPVSDNPNVMLWAVLGAGSDHTDAAINGGSDKLQHSSGLDPQATIRWGCRCCKAIKICRTWSHWRCGRNGLPPGGTPPD
jgi:hypothetical protein